MRGMGNWGHVKGAGWGEQKSEWETEVGEKGSLKKMVGSLGRGCKRMEELEEKKDRGKSEPK